MSEVITLPYQWAPRDYQLPVWEYMEEHPVGARAVCIWHRRAGKDLLAINLIATKAHERVGTYWHVFPELKQGKNIAWNGVTKEGRKFLSHFPDELVESVNSTDLRVHFKNGSIYQVVGTDNLNSLVGTNPVGCVFSEYSLQDPDAWNYLRPILAENDGWALFIYTPRGKNHGKKLRDMAEKNPNWFLQELKAGDEGTKRSDGSPVISNSVIDEERKSGMPEALIQQEFFVSFEAPLVGAYYGDQMASLMERGMITAVPHEPRLNVETYWDLGVDDSTSIWFVQRHGLEFRIIDYYEASGEGLPHYAKVLQGQRSDSRHRSDYTYSVHWAPHDIAVRELGSGKSRLETARALGIRFKVSKKHNLEDGIEACRSVLPTCWFDIARCERGLEALKSYQKQWDDRLKTFRDQPLHNWASHAADAFRTFAWNSKPVSPFGSRAPQRTMRDEHDYLSL